MKPTRLLPLLLVLCLLAGCRRAAPPETAAPSVPDPSPSPVETAEPTAPPLSLRFTRENFPRLNGSTSTVPLGQAIASVLLGERRADVADLIRFSRTTQSFRALMDGDADLLISAEPAETIWAEKEERGFEWEMEPFAVDALVFLVNADNPVDSLTTEQIRGIYSGQITNWSEVGGDDLDIVPFQRNAEAGSQTAMRKLVMKDLPMMEAPAEYVRGEMGDLIEAVASYDGTPAAIGYTVYYYANDMKMADGLKILAVDGVEPNDGTIRAKEYPFLNNYYVLTAAGLPEDAPAKLLYDWLLSEEGQRLVAHEGYVSVLDVDGGWPGLDPYAHPEPLYRYSERYCGAGPLRAWDGYGALLPYVGALPTVDYLVDRLPLYGLMTARGELVTDPVYSHIGVGGGFVWLQKGQGELTVAAGDGSWVLEASGCRVENYWPEDGGLLALLGPDSLTFLDGGGRERAKFPASAFGRPLPEGYGEGYLELVPYEGIVYAGFFDMGDIGGETWYYLDLASGEVLDAPPDGYPAEPVYDGDDPAAAPDFPGYQTAYALEDPITGALYYEALRPEGGFDLLDGTGKVLWSDYEEPDVSFPPVLDGMIAVLPNSWGNTAVTLNWFSWYDLDTGACVFRYPIAENSD